MIRTTRTLTVTLLSLVATSWLCAAGCSGSNEPAITTGAGGSSSSASSSDTSSSTTGSGGTTGSSGTAGSGGSSGAGGGMTFTPLCAGLTTEAGPSPTKGGACTANDPQFCYKTCGPESIGFKSETCMGGFYVEQSGCTFPANGDYSCYKIPAMIDPSCPTMPPKATDPCTVAPCTLCNVNGTYLDSSGAAKMGYCVCTSSGSWSCASTTSWPCPAGNGC